MNKYIFFIFLTFQISVNSFLSTSFYNIKNTPLLKSRLQLRLQPKLQPRLQPILRLSNNNITNEYNNDNDNKYNKLSPLIINPIKKIEYDTIFYNIKNITHVFLSSNFDRIVIFFNNNKGVYYFNEENELHVIDNILKSNNINMKIIKYYTREMDSYDGALYCEPKNSDDTNNIIIEDLQATQLKLDNIYKYYVEADKNNSSYNYDKNKFLKPIIKPVLVTPIKEIEYDDILYNVKNISYVFLSGNYDRVVVFFNTTKGVYYFKNNKELNRIEYMLKLNNIKIKIINDYIRIMDTYNGILYCEPRYHNYMDDIDIYDDDDINDDDDYDDDDDDDDDDDIIYIDDIEDIEDNNHNNHNEDYISISIEYVDDNDANDVELENYNLQYLKDIYDLEKIYNTTDKKIK